MSPTSKELATIARLECQAASLTSELRVLKQLALQAAGWPIKDIACYASRRTAEPGIEYTFKDGTKGRGRMRTVYYDPLSRTGWCTFNLNEAYERLRKRLCCQPGSKAA